MAMSIGANDDSGPIADMNTTPLVDVMLVLLILFIITLPVMTNSTNLHIGKGPAIAGRRASRSAWRSSSTARSSGTARSSKTWRSSSATSWSRPARPTSRSCTCSPTGARSTTASRRCWRSPSAAACSASASPDRNASWNRSLETKENASTPVCWRERPARRNYLGSRRGHPLLGSTIGSGGGPSASFRRLGPRSLSAPVRRRRTATPRGSVDGGPLAPLAPGLQSGETLGFFHRHQLLSRIAVHRATLHRSSSSLRGAVSAAFRRRRNQTDAESFGRASALSLAKRTTRDF